MSILGARAAFQSVRPGRPLLEVVLLLSAVVLAVTGLAMGLNSPLLGIAVCVLLAASLAMRLSSAPKADVGQVKTWRHLASHDALTGLPNRAAFADRLERSWNRSREVAVLFIDLVGFKDVNDTLGHAVGDELLVEVAGRLSRALRERDVVARLGGDEFVALLSDCARIDALGVGERLRSVLGEPYEVEGRTVRISASIGISPPGSTIDPEQAMRQADLALYRAKGQGRDRVCEFDDGLARDADVRRLGAAFVETALRDGGLRLEYQPEIELGTGDVLAVEALLRVDGGGPYPLPIDQLVSACEEHGLARQLATWVLDHALGDVDRWLSHGWTGRVSVNISCALLADSDLDLVVKRLLDRHGLPGSILALEFAEPGLRGRPDDAARVLHRIRELGVLTVLDDFGSGQSSLAVLRWFPWDVLKVDRALMTTEGDMSAPLARLCADLGHVVVAEGIETPRQLAEQRAAGVSRGQGYLLAAPLRPEDLEVVLSVGSVVLPTP